LNAQLYILHILGDEGTERNRRRASDTETMRTYRGMRQQENQALDKIFVAPYVSKFRVLTQIPYYLLVY